MKPDYIFTTYYGVQYASYTTIDSSGKEHVEILIIDTTATKPI